METHGFDDRHGAILFNVILPKMSLEQNMQLIFVDCLLVSPVICSEIFY